MILRTMIVEDEPHARVRLQDLLAVMNDIEVIAEAGDGAQAVEAIDRLQPDLVLLDIEMPGFSGLEVLQRLRHRPLVIFITAYDQYAVPAFEANAVDYLLKPFTVERLEQALERVRQRGRFIDSDLLEELQRRLRPKQYLHHFAVKHDEEILLVPEDEVFFFLAEDKYVFLYTASRRFFYDATLKGLEDRLDPERFMRIHKSAIVAVRQVRKLKRSLMGDYQVVLGDDKATILRVGRSFLAAVKSRLGF
jgi:two-component system, LytTR family, response regulator